ncbi:DNA/RNA non-specific endonuclease [Lactovum odontotermitis]
MVSGMAQMSVYDIGKGVNTLFTNGEARQQMLDGIGSWWNQLPSGDAVAIGKTGFNLASIFIGGAEVKGAAQIAKASSAEGLLAKSGVFIKALGQTTVKNAVETGKMFKNLPGNLKNGAERFSTKIYDSRFAAGMREVLGNPRVAFAGIRDSRSAMSLVGKDVKEISTGTSRANFSEESSGVSSKGSGEAPSSVRAEFVKNPFVKGEGGKLRPNVQYRASAPGTNHSYIYETNLEGDIVRVRADELSWKGDRKRLTNKRNTPDKLKDDEAGHLIADQFDGSPELDNLVSQARDLNRGAGSEWKEMETQWRDALTGNPPKKVTDVQIDVQYEVGSHRPIGFDVQYTIEGQKTVTRSFPNVMKGAN